LPTDTPTTSIYPTISALTSSEYPKTVDNEASKVSTANRRKRIHYKAKGARKGRRVRRKGGKGQSPTTVDNEASKKSTAKRRKRIYNKTKRGKTKKGRSVGRKGGKGRATKRVPIDR
jgi:hypothetical protein